MEEIKILTNATLIDGNYNSDIKNQMIVIKKKKIQYVGEMSKEVLHTYSDATIIDVNGKTVMPGMIDAHVHLTLDGEPSYLMTLIKEDAKLTVLKGFKRAEKALQAGFTTIRCLGEKGPVDVAIKEAIDTGVIEGPNIISSGKAITITGGHGDMFPEGITIDGLATIIDGEDGARKAAREQLKLGVDNLKMMATGGGMSPGPGTIAQLTVNEMKAVVEEAEKYGKITAAHAIGSEGIVNALHAGIRTIEHGTFLNEEGIDLLLKNNSYLVPTLAAFKTLMYGEKGGVPEYHLEKVRFYQSQHVDNLKRALDRGVKVITGTDAGTAFNYHGDNAYELEALVNAGMSEIEAIKAATSLAAEALNLSDKGIIADGMVADVIIVDGNPLQDITILQKGAVETVIKEGKIVYTKEEKKIILH
ncbi:MAG: amidohydrolase family protein [Oceanobacillus sp.]|nr:amidohydrolase family protein [Oceanobacillus sp.]PAE28392.1 amidohydrolase [Paenibacillus sp. 7884-2]